LLKKIEELRPVQQQTQIRREVVKSETVENGKGNAISAWQYKFK
jgi:hypothetical protein